MLGGVKWRCEVDGGCGKKDQEQEKRERVEGSWG